MYPKVGAVLQHRRDPLTNERTFGFGFRISLDIPFVNGLINLNGGQITTYPGKNVNNEFGITTYPFRVSGEKYISKRRNYAFGMMAITYLSLLLPNYL